MNTSHVADVTLRFPVPQTATGAARSGPSHPDTVGPRTHGGGTEASVGGAHDATALGYVPPLDGVRAFAVLAVMVFHGGVGSLTGGFLGVDTFFVLSGFLITTLLVREWSDKHTIKLAAFWARRARRLLPALLLVLLFVAAFAYFIVPTSTYPGLRADSLFALFYTANWHFIAAGANYFNATGPVSPLTHTWSLAVEEQFYLVWPLVVIGVMALARRQTVKGLRLLLLVSVGGALLSAIEMAALWNGTNQTRLYYGTDTHAQCLLVGASLAVLLTLAAHARQRRGTAPLHVDVGGDPAWSATSPMHRRALTVIGVVGISITALLWTHVNGHQWWLYHGGFLVAALATACVLLSAVCAQRGLVARILSIRPLRFLGRISYGLYLWHFPLFVWLDHARTGLSGWWLFALRFLVTLAVATASYRWVERPIRQGSLLRGWRTLVVAPTTVAAVAGILVLATPALSASEQLASGAPTSQPATQSALASSPGAPVLLVGDSMAETLGNGVGGAVGRHFKLNVINAGDPNCSLAIGTFEVENFPPNPSAPACDPSSGQPLWPARWESLVRQYQPKVSVFVARLDVVNRLYQGQWTHIGEPAYDHYLIGQIQLAVRILSSQGGKVVFLTSPYYDTGEQPSGAPWPEDNPARVDRYNAMLEKVAAQHPGTVYVIDLNKIADPNGHFQPYIGGTEVRYTDGIHWTYQGDCWLAPRILPPIATVAQTGALPPPQTVATMQRQAEASFPTSLCHAPN